MNIPNAKDVAEKALAVERSRLEAELSSLKTSIEEAAEKGQFEIAVTDISSEAKALLVQAGYDILLPTRFGAKEPTFSISWKP
jgi:hypothetical protein